MNGDAEPVRAAELARAGAMTALVVLVCAVAFYGPGIASGTRAFFTHDVSHSDIWHLNLPLKALYDRALAEGRLPLWSPELGGGFPLHAQGEVGSLYPLNLLLYGALPLLLAFNWSVLLHAALAGAFAAMLARELGANRAGAVLAGVVLAFSGFFVVHVKHAAMTAAAVWAPLLLLVVERFARGGSAAHVALVALATAAMLLAGHPQIAYYTLLVVLAWIAVRAVGMRRRSGALAFAGALGYGLLLAALLAAPQILPTLELNALGPRHGGLSRPEATEWRCEWAHVVGFVRPYAFGDPGTGGFRQVGPGKSLFWEVTAYVGLLPLALAACAVALGRRRRAVLMLSALAVVSLLLSLGPSGGLFEIAWRVVPGFRYFRFQSRFLLFTDLALALLAGLGMTLLAERRPHLARGKLGAAIGALLVLLCFTDSFVALGKHNPTVDAARWLAPPPSARRIEREEKGHGEPFRIVANDPDREVFRNAYLRAGGWHGDLTPYGDAWNLLRPNLSALYGLHNLDVFLPLYPKWAGDAVRLLGAPGSGPVHVGLASLFNVRYVLDATGRVPADGGLSLLETYPAGPLEVRLLENHVALPRAFLVPAARFVVEPPVSGEAMPESVRALVAPGFDPRREVVIALEPGETPAPAEPEQAPIAIPVRFERYAPHEVRLRLELAAPRSCWLVLADTFYPGWRATVDGNAVRIERANVAMRAVRLDEGASEVVFRYRPASFVRGLLAAALGIALVATVPLQARFARIVRRGGVVRSASRVNG